MPQDKKTYTVVGICRKPVFEQSSAPGYTLITKEDKQVQPGSLTLFVTIKNPHQIRSYLSRTKDPCSYT
ncbi:hypothetical protein, partial [Clostridioides difficile]|uniref:hypothetical protein n=1 Tax=Clostridioides difficile TaxID=1496 RepID=UPI001F4768D5